MENYSIEGTAKTPTITFDLSKGSLEIKGRSIHENPIDFFKPLRDAMDVYAASAQPTTTVSMKLDYFNSSSAKCIFHIFKKLETLNKNGSKVTINWYYEDDDYEMLEAGEEYQEIIEVPFKLLAIEEE